MVLAIARVESGSNHNSDVEIKQRWTKLKIHKTFDWTLKINSSVKEESRICRKSYNVFFFANFLAQLSLCTPNFNDNVTPYLFFLSGLLATIPPFFFFFCLWFSMATDQNTSIITYIFWPTDWKNDDVQLAKRKKNGQYLKKLQQLKSELQLIIRQRFCVEFIDDEGTKTINFWHSLCIRFVFFFSLLHNTFESVSIMLEIHKFVRFFFFVLACYINMCFEKYTPNGA